MKPVLACLILFLTTSFAHAASDEADLKTLRGTWKPAQAELAGKEVPAAMLAAVTLKIEDSNYVAIVEREDKTITDKGTFTIDPSAKPKGMTITGVDGPSAGRSFPAIYELTTDTLRVCYDLAQGASRPSEFKTTEGTRLYLVTYKKVEAK